MMFNIIYMIKKCHNVYLYYNNGRKKGGDPKQKKHCVLWEASMEVCSFMEIA